MYSVLWSSSNAEQAARERSGMKKSEAQVHNPVSTLRVASRSCWGDFPPLIAGLALV
jgi:hypothetical protein